MHFVTAICLAILASDAAETIGRLAHPAIKEASGIVKSRRHAGIYWVHNDSGNPPALFAVRRDGTLVREYAVSAPNVDWEDIATDDDGHLYVGDIGNNDLRLPIRAIYRVDEPDPAVKAEKPLEVTRAIFYKFPRTGRFDCEAMVIDRDRVILIAKTTDSREAEIYVLPLNTVAPLMRPATPERIGALPGFTRPVTGADLSADGQWLAVCSPTEARVYERADDGWKCIGQASYRDESIEAICWDDRDLILAGEGRGLYRVAEARWRADASTLKAGK
jgi:hypothetical protein